MIIQETNAAVVDANEPLIKRILNIIHDHLPKGMRGKPCTL